MYTDLTEEVLRAYRSSQSDPGDFDEFWQSTLADARRVGDSVSVSPVRTPLSTLDVFDVTFPGWAGERVAAWLRLPAGTAGGGPAAPLPVVVEYVGYGGGRGAATDSLFWASCGFAHLVMDTRGQGSGWSPGVTPDSGSTGPQVPGVMTRGILSRDTYYYRRLFTDAVRAVDAVRTLAFLDPGRVAVLGTSQGGGTALAVAGLVPDVAALAARVPFLCDFPRGVTVTDAHPFREVADFLAVHRGRADAVLSVLSYFDGVNFARRAVAPAVFSAALMDQVVPPSTVFAAHHAYAGPSRIDVWRFNGHEGGGTADDLAALELFHAHLGDPAGRRTGPTGGDPTTRATGPETP